MNIARALPWWRSAEPSHWWRLCGMPFSGTDPPPPLGSAQQRARSLRQPIRPEKKRKTGVRVYTTNLKAYIPTVWAGPHESQLLKAHYISNTHICFQVVATICLLCILLGLARLLKSGQSQTNDLVLQGVSFENTKRKKKNNQYVHTSVTNNTKSAEDGTTLGLCTHKRHNHQLVAGR